MPAHDSIPVAGLILAGGKSSRMGRDKAGLMLAGETLLARSRRVLEAAGCDPIMMSGAHVGGLVDNYPEKGPLGGIQAGLQVLNQDPEKKEGTRLLVIPVDMPKLSESTLHPLLNARTQSPVYFENSALPCVLPVTPAVSSYLEACLASEGSDCSVMSLLRFFDAQAISPSDPEQLINTNTPEQWRAAVKEERL